ncbi:MAG: hypothetical protein K2M90_08755, partial [Treponemataceae bacterium]|nr:hypothetical protein [Treponemataceae bacterium]
VLGKVGGLEGENPRFRVEGLSPSKNVPPLSSGKALWQHVRKKRHFSANFPKKCKTVRKLLTTKNYKTAIMPHWQEFCLWCCRIMKHNRKNVFSGRLTLWRAAVPRAWGGVKYAPL